MTKKCCIISAGDVNTALLKKMKPDYDFFIAADLGYEKALEADITPSLLVGDFDSIGQSFDNFSNTNALSDKKYTTPDTPKLLRFPIEKDYSDTHLALEEGIKLGYTEFDVYGALGGDRFCHSLANLQTTCAMKSKGISVTLVGMKEIVYLLQNESIKLAPPIHSTFSVFSLSEKSEAVTIQGAKYPLANATLTNSFPLGVSNHTTEENLHISVKDGFLLVIVEFE